MKKISIIIPIHNRIKMTQEGLRYLDSSLQTYSFEGEKKLSFDVIVVDDGSSDGSSEWITTNFPEVHLLKGNGDLWWSGSVNFGVKHAIGILQSDYVLLWNDDTYCENDYFVNMEKHLQTGMFDNSILVSKILWENSRRRIFNFGCTFNSKTGKKELIGANEYDNGQYEEILKIDWSGGMGTLIPVSVIHKIGYFDAVNFPQYFGDADYFLKAREANIQSYAIPNLVLYNRFNSSGIQVNGSFYLYFKSLFSIRSNNNIRTNILFYKRHSKSRVAYLYLIYGYIHYSGSIVKSMIKSMWNGKNI